jgi:hypothetical protein
MTSGRRKLDERLAALRDERERGEGDRERTDGQMAEALAEAEAELAAVRQAAADPRRTGEPAPVVLDELEAMIDTQRRRIDDRAKMINEARVTIGRLGGSVAVRAGRGLDERMDECCRRRDMLLGEQACFQLDARALGLLKETLTAAANDAKAHFHAPLAARLTPYVQALLPEAEPEVTPDFGITALHRGKPVSERFEQLSDGTREQIAILARLAFAQMLKEQGLPALVILDDALVFSDQQRLARMFAILEKAATSLQIIILTCHEDRFRGLKAKHLAIQQRAAAA